MLKTIPLTGVIYLYRNRNTGENLYVGQSYQFDKRIKDHLRMNRTRADVKLREIGEENIEILILHEKIFNEYTDNKQNREAYQIWANEKEKEEIKNYDTYENGLNGTKGGQHNNQEVTFTEWSHKQSNKFFEIFIKAAKIYIQKENNILGACPRNYILMEMNNYKLGEELHKFRSNEYKTIWADEECVKLLNEVGYTKTSKDAGVVASDRWGKSRIDNKWEKLKLILEWIYKEYEHINLTQGSDNPDNFPNELLEGLNYKKISSIIYDIRSGNVVGNDNERKEFLKSLNYFETANKFNDHKFIIGMKWYYENFNFSYPQQYMIIPNNTILPKYMIDFKIGTFYANRTKTNTIPDEIKELIEINKNKPRQSRNNKSIFK